MIHTLQAEFPNVPIGYSGHETGLQTTLAAVALGAVFVERHITWIVPCGAPIRRRRSSPKVCSALCATSGDL